ncbi:MAG TPA: type IV pilus biogenesis/stability protein PilW [Xanthomonadaceae bacterium]|nr:type IV pilus biogenesis/stability protein PilW [Xanthomonadaceae bacterium]
MQPDRLALLLAPVLALSACATGGGRSSASETGTTRSAADVNVQLGQKYMERGDLEIAMEKLRKAVELDPRSADAHTMLGVLYERIGRVELAGEHYARSVALDGDDGVMLNNYGGFLCRQRRYDEADAMFAKALEDPFYRTPNAALTNAGVCAMQAGRLERAESYLRRALEKEPRNSGALFQLAQVNFAKGEFLSARAFIQRLEAASPATAEALSLAARIEERLGDKAAADKYRKRLRTEFPDYRPPKTSGETSSS